MESGNGQTSRRHRRTHAGCLADADTNLSQIALTMNTYSHVTPSLAREASDQLQDMLGPTG